MPSLSRPPPPYTPKPLPLQPLWTPIDPCAWLWNSCRIHAAGSRAPVYVAFCRTRSSLRRSSQFTSLKVFAPRKAFSMHTQLCSQFTSFEVFSLKRAFEGAQQHTPVKLQISEQILGHTFTFCRNFHKIMFIFGYNVAIIMFANPRGYISTMMGWLRD